jgi:hypothetical protein
MPGKLNPGVLIPLLGFLLQFFGFQWDVAWHISLGRETFWAPPHVVVYLGVGLVLASGVSTIVRHRGQAPPGAYLIAASGLTQVLSAPLDELWHQLYGLDVTLWSFPHVVFVVAGCASVLGLVLLSGPRPESPVDAVAIDGVLEREGASPGREPPPLAQVLRAPRLVWRPRAFLSDPVPPLFGLFMAGLNIMLLEFEYRIPSFIFDVDFVVFPPLMIAIALLAGLAALGLTRRVGAVTVVCLCFTLLELAANLELVAMRYRWLPHVPLILPGAVLVDLLLARGRLAPFGLRLLLASLVFGAVFYAVQFPYTTFARPAWTARLVTQGWPLALLLAPLAAAAGLALGQGLAALGGRQPHRTRRPLTFRQASP